MLRDSGRRGRPLCPSDRLEEDPLEDVVVEDGEEEEEKVSLE